LVVLKYHLRKLITHNKSRIYKKKCGMPAGEVCVELLGQPVGIVSTTSQHSFVVKLIEEKQDHCTTNRLK